MRSANPLAALNVPPVQAGEFLRRSGAAGGQPAMAVRVGVAAAAIAALSLIGAVAALLLWVVTVLLPVAIGAGLVAYAAFRIQFGRRLDAPHAG